jgi:hypothetical protein
MESSTSNNFHLQEISSPTLPIAKKDESSEKSSSSIDKNPKKKANKLRPSASKKYSGQIMLGVGKMAISLLQFSIQPIDKLVIEKVMKEILGKSNEEYKINTIEKIRSFFVVVEEDDLISRAIKLKFHMLIIHFFGDQYYNFWLTKLFKGSEVNKRWYELNKINLIDKILHNKRVNFFMDASESPYETGNLTVKDELELFNKKVKIEEPDEGKNMLI